MRISSVDKASPADKAGIKAGETLISINGHNIADVLDYRFYMLERHLTVIVSGDGDTPRTVKIKKGEYDEPGLNFDTYLMDKQHCCKNKCIFCFIDQMPPGMRESLYFKDDDSRLGFLFGNYITLTNLSREDIDRIVKMHLSPVNVSVHTTEPELRVKMMANPNAASSLDYLKVLAEGRIALHTQLVLCPGINDGEHLRRSLNDLSKLSPAVESIAAVPVGLTKYREGLFPLKPYTPKEAGEVIDIIEEFSEKELKKQGTRLAYPADEFFIKAGRDFPDYDYYGEFTQLENGVGLCAMLIHEFNEALEDEENVPCQRTVTIATGVAAYELIKKLAKSAEEKFSGLSVQVICVKNEFFGENVTVTGLLTGKDLIKNLSSGVRGEEILICEAMLRHEQDRFLDDITPEDLEKESGKPIKIVKNDGYALLYAMLGKEEGEYYV